MTEMLLLHILGIIAFIILLYIGMTLSKKKAGYAKFVGYILMIASIIGLLIDIYSLMHNILM
jgi:hypothetical protein